MRSVDQFLCNVLDRFGPGHTQSQMWQAANDLIGDLGGCSLTMGAIGAQDGVPAWMRSSMSDAWLAEYVDQRFYEADQLTAHTRVSDSPVAFISGTETSRECKLWYGLNHGLKEAGYRTLYLTPFSAGTSKLRSAVTFNSEHKWSDLNDPELLRKIRILSTFMVAHLGAPEQGEHADTGAIVWNKTALSDRERETLTYLAQGLRNTQIAHAMGIAEISVRKNILSARRKLGAATREQAIAIAVQQALITL